MFQTVLFIKLLLVHYATQSRTEIQANCSEDVQLKCRNVDIDSMDYLSVSWYKLNNQRKSGIIRRSKPDMLTQHYKFSRNASFGEKHSLLLQSVTPEDSGIYECAISANVGSRNHNCNVVLRVSECATQADVTTMPNVLNTTHSNPLCPNQPKDLPVMWSIIGYVAVGLTKIILSLISIWVIRAVHKRSSR